MTTPDNAHRAEFSVRCACGIEYHTSDAHAGRTIPCKCGRNVQLIRPVELASAEDDTPSRRRKRKVRRSGNAAYNHSYHASTGETERAANLNWQRRRWSVRSVANAFVRPFTRGSLLVRVTAGAAWLYLIGMFVAWMLLITTSEHAIPGTIIAYGPRWLSLWPLAILAPATLILARSALVPLALAAFIGIVPIMGARITFATISSRKLPPAPVPGTFRVVTFNAQGGRPLASRLSEFLDRYKPDVALFQECGDALWTSIQAQAGWQSARHGTLCSASHWTMGDVETMPRDEFAKAAEQGFGGTGLVMRVRFGSPNGPLSVVNLHLETARRGLEGMLGQQGIIPDDPFGISGDAKLEPTLDASENRNRFMKNAAIREKESLAASRWAVESNAGAPLLIAGDFNLPVESTIFRKYWSNFTDAFEERGNGLGWTKTEGRWLRIRIDHLLTTDGGPKPVRIMVGANYLSDHLPVIADYAWPTIQGR
ncbi:MAG: endonuclease/exonuclease/phosphatase family protein [Gemmatimonadaceae bacterium]